MNLNLEDCGNFKSFPKVYFVETYIEGNCECKSHLLEHGELYYLGIEVFRVTKCAQSFLIYHTCVLSFWFCVK